MGAPRGPPRPPSGGLAVGRPEPSPALGAGGRSADCGGRVCGGRAPGVLRLGLVPRVLASATGSFAEDVTVLQGVAQGPSGFFFIFLKSDQMGLRLGFS